MPNSLWNIFNKKQLSDQNAQSWPELQSSWAGREIEMPNETNKTNSVGPMGFLQRYLHPDAYASTSPFGNISLNRPLIEKDKQDLSDVLVHELVHVGQGKSGFLKHYINPNEMENEAINKEATRKVRRKDIYLQTMKSK